MRQYRAELLCCLKTLQSLDLTYDPFKTFTSYKQQNLTSSTLTKNEISTLVKVAKCIIYIASMHVDPLQIIGEQILLSKYLYRFRYFYKISKAKQLKYQYRKHCNYSVLEINTIALETLFLLAKY
jgi:hypothetical protein